jgi:hypothetical protein
VQPQAVKAVLLDFFFGKRIRDKQKLALTSRALFPIENWNFGEDNQCN